MMGTPVDFSIYLGHLYDLEVEMSPDFLITGSSTIEEEIILPQNTTSVQEKISSEAPNKKTSPNTNTISSSRRKSFLKSSRSSPISLNKGSNSPSVYQIDLLPSQNSDTSKKEKQNWN